MPFPKETVLLGQQKEKQDQYVEEEAKGVNEEDKRFIVVCNDTQKDKK